MTFNLSGASLLKMNGVHPDLQKVVKRSIELSTVDFRVIQGVRTQEYQDELYAQGRTKPGKIITNTRDSKHIHGLAVDLAALIDGAISWEPQYYSSIATAMYDASKELQIPITWGGDWKIKDLDHFELADSRK